MYFNAMISLSVKRQWYGFIKDTHLFYIRNLVGKPLGLNLSKDEATSLTTMRS